MDSSVESNFKLLSLTRKKKMIEGKEAIVLKDIVVPQKYYDRIKLGNSILDELFGGPETPGIIIGNTIMFTGSPGAGKSTASMQLADVLQSYNFLKTMYNSCEESPYMVKIRADRLQLKQEFELCEIMEVDRLIEYALENNVRILVQDSIQKLRDGDLRGDRRQNSVVEKLKKFGDNHGVVVILICHVTKGGVYAGSGTVKHDVDAHLHLSVPGDGGARVLMMEKNRMGPSMVPFEFSMTAKGMDFGSAKQIDTAPPKTISKAKASQEQIVGLIKDRIRAGDKISGYCFDRLGVDVSGGFWRGMVEKAVTQMKKDGFIIGETVINRRSHVYMEQAP